MDLKKIREEIDLLDSKILNLLNGRMELALMAKKLKHQIEDAQREKEILERIRSNSRGLINAEFIEKVYLEIIRESKALQHKDYPLIAFQGEHGAYGELAAMAWDKEFVPVPCPEFPDVFEGVKSGLYDCGIVPVENTLGAWVAQANRLLINTDLFVVGAVELAVHHCLLALPEMDHREIRSVYSHSQTLSQCRQFLARNKLEPIPFYDSAGAAKMLAETKPKAGAAIASELAAEVYGLEIMKDNMGDIDRNLTRYLVLSRKESKAPGNKCSLVFSTEHKAGTLFKVLDVFARESINLTRIESIPAKPGDYVFILDFMGSTEEGHVLKALAEVGQITRAFRVLGCYTEKKVP